MLSMLTEPDHISFNKFLMCCYAEYDKSNIHSKYAISTLSSSAEFITEVLKEPTEISTTLRTFFQTYRQNRTSRNRHITAELESVAEIHLTSEEAFKLEIALTCVACDNIEVYKALQSSFADYESLRQFNTTEYISIKYAIQYEATNILSHVLENPEISLFHTPYTLTDTYIDVIDTYDKYRYISSLQTQLAIGPGAYAVNLGIGDQSSCATLVEEHISLLNTEPCMQLIEVVGFDIEELCSEYAIDGLNRQPFSELLAYNRIRRKYSESFENLETLKALRHASLAEVFSLLETDQLNISDAQKLVILHKPCSSRRI